MAIILDGRVVAQHLQLQLQQALNQFDKPLQLAILLVGQNPASLTYIKRKQKLASALGIQVLLEQYDENTTTQSLIAAVQTHNLSQTSGILVQLPLPSHIDTQSVLEALDPNKDVDGLNPINLGRLMNGQPTLVPATARGVVALLKYYDIPIAGQQVVVVGRSRLVGQPVAQLLLQQNATITIAHRQTKALASVTQLADIVVVAAGQPGLIVPTMIKAGATVIDVGLTKTDQGIMGDVDPSVSRKAGAMSPVPGGVGPLTVSCLMQNIVQAALLQSKYD
jgi:methylenetetrahydrofolate dehydrogenase (NADP+)/methenyltetrahydrofolate cyclohydrolase